MTTLYVLHHIHANEYGDIQEKGLGNFTSVERARQAAAELRKMPGFSKYPDDFRLFACTVDQIRWPDGFPPADKKLDHIPAGDIRV